MSAHMKLQNKYRNWVLHLGTQRFHVTLFSFNTESVFLNMFIFHLFFFILIFLFSCLFYLPRAAGRVLMMSESREKQIHRKHSD